MNVIESPRLTLRELDLTDAEFIVRLLNEAPFLKFIGDKGVRTLADAREYLLNGPIGSYRRHGFGLYHASLREGGVPVGICGLVKREALADVDLGFAFLSQHWSRGYASESAAAVLDYGRRQLRIKRIVAITAPQNFASIAVLTKVGLRFERMVTLPEQGEELKLFAPAEPSDGA